MRENNDFRQRFLFPDSDLRGEIVHLESSLEPALAGRDYPLLLRGLLAESLTASALLSSTLKFEGRLSLQAQGDGPIRLLMAECDHEGHLRGLARYDELSESTEQPPLSDLLGQGRMAITIMPDQGRQYQGLVPLERATLAQCVEDYFERSEQLPTRLWLAAGNNRAAGLLLQRLPERAAHAERNADLWQHLTTLADSLTMEELLDLGAETVLHRLFHETPPELAPARPLQFQCSCSRERVRNTLLSLGAAELRDIIETQGEAEITCEFCGARERFDQVDLSELIRELEA